MTFRQELVERAKGRGARILLPEGGDPRVQAAARRLESEGILEPILIGPGGIDPARDPRVSQVAQHLRERRPDRVHDAIHAIDLASDPLRFAAALVALGEADGCVAGATHTTADVLRAALWAIGPEPSETPRPATLPFHGVPLNRLPTSMRGSVSRTRYTCHSLAFP